MSDTFGIAILLAIFTNSQPLPTRIAFIPISRGIRRMFTRKASMPTNFFAVVANDIPHRFLL